MATVLLLKKKKQTQTQKDKKNPIQLLYMFFISQATIGSRCYVLSPHSFCIFIKVLTLVTSCLHYKGIFLFLYLYGWLMDHCSEKTIFLSCCMTLSLFHDSFMILSKSRSLLYSCLACPVCEGTTGPLCHKGLPFGRQVCDTWLSPRLSLVGHMAKYAFVTPNLPAGSPSHLQQQLFQ